MGGDLNLMNLTFRQKLTYMGHLYKALIKQHHKPLIPMLQKFIPLDGIVIDVGGHAGQFTKIFSCLAKKGKIFSFEPGEYAYSILKKTKKIKKLTNVTLIQKGLSSLEGLVSFRVPIKRSGSIGYGTSHVFLSGHETISSAFIEQQVSVIPLDKFIKINQLERIDFIKIDVEGHELNVLKGAQETIKVYRPSIMIEINSEHLDRAGVDKTKIFEFLENIGYKSARIDDLMGTLDLNHHRQNGDYIFSFLI